jgi:hypothetical protein
LQTGTNPRSRTIDIWSSGTFAVSVSTTIRASGVQESRLAAIVIDVNRTRRSDVGALERKTERATASIGGAAVVA